MSLADRTVLVTGATSGIGLSTVTHLLEQGSRVLALGRSFSQLDSLYPETGTHSLERIPYDLMQLDGYRELVAGFPKLNGVVLSAGIAINNPIKFFSLEKYQRTITLNQTSPLLLVAELYRAGKLAENASIVFVSSISGTVVGMKGLVDYSASKAALVGITRTLALELGLRKIRINCVSPGMVNTPMVDNSTTLSHEDIEADKKKYPLGQRYLESDEVARSIGFLLSNNSSFTTGQNMVIDGGFCIH